MPFSVFDEKKKNADNRTRKFLFFSLAFNFAYSIFLLIISLVYSSKWFFVMSIYYALIFAVRVFIYIQINRKKGERSELLTMWACGCFLLLINLVVSTIMFILIYEGNAVSHGKIIVIGIATYTFLSLSLAIIGCLRYLKRNNHVYSCAKIVSLISASVSLATLTNTMLETFGENNLLLRSIILPILCGAISIFIILCAIFMIRKANSNLRILKNEEKR